jgi:hypothetical protein
MTETSAEPMRNTTFDLFHSLTVAVVLTACGGSSHAETSTGPPVGSSSEITVAWFGQTPAFSDPGRLRVRLGVGGTVAEVRGSEMKVPEGSAWFESRPYPVPESGSLPILVSYLGPAGDTVARATLAINGLMPGFRYGVSVYAGGRNPAASGPSICGSPPVAVAVPRSGDAASDSLYIATGGLPKGAVC